MSTSIIIILNNALRLKSLRVRVKVMHESFSLLHIKISGMFITCRYSSDHWSPPHDNIGNDVPSGISSCPEIAPNNYLSTEVRKIAMPPGLFVYSCYNNYSRYNYIP